jgi:hypothetical protein
MDILFFLTVVEMAGAATFRVFRPYAASGFICLFRSSVC